MKTLVESVDSFAFALALPFAFGQVATCPYINWE